ncbi:unnamed protein product [Protopolystoma xenopodis]|uniref:Uncharacterized protein n=1 Tax=Protopolystoma xenopodis TaxID=117903 RepID=A0A3S5ATE0_9PLAT|nr:unnamed protein product [Protopolystoma xenopodis]
MLDSDGEVDHSLSLKNGSYKSECYLQPPDIVGSSIASVSMTHNVGTVLYISPEILAERHWRSETGRGRIAYDEVVFYFFYKLTS